MRFLIFLKRQLDFIWKSPGFCVPIHKHASIIYSELNDLDKIRESCELFSSQFPLAPEIWTKWLQIELTIAASDAEVKRVHGLFKRALNDYFCKFEKNFL